VEAERNNKAKEKEQDNNEDKHRLLVFNIRGEGVREVGPN
jgi:hypothetical protein